MSSSNSSMVGKGAQQVVSEPLDPAIESSRGRSSSHGGSGGGSPDGRRVPAAEERILLIEGTLGALSGTVLDLSDKFARIERMFEDLARSKRNTEISNQNSHSSPNPHFSPNAQSPFPFIQMSNSPVTAHNNHPWNENASTMNPVLINNDQTPGGHPNPPQTFRNQAMGSMTSGHEFMLMGLHVEPETRIRILTAATRKYKEKRDSKIFEKQLPDEVSMLQPVAYMETDYSKVSSVSDDSLNQIAEEDPPVKATTKNSLPVVYIVNLEANGKLIEALTEFADPIPQTKFLLSLDRDRLELDLQSVIAADVSTKYKQFLNAVVEFDSISATLDEYKTGIGLNKHDFSNLKTALMKIWDPGIEIIHSLTLGQGQFEGVGIDKTLS